MNGYLQRLALRAIEPLESVHPVVGFVFSAPKYGREREGSLMQGDDLSSIEADSLNPVHPVLGSAMSASKNASEREGSLMQGDDLPSIEEDSLNPVHPVLGSVLSASKNASEREGFPMEGDDFPRNRLESLVTPAPDPIRPFHDPRTGPEPLVRNERVPILQVERTAKPRPISEVPQTQNETARTPKSNVHRERRGQKEPSGPTYTPLITENFVRPNNEDIFRRESNAFASGAREKRDLSGRPVPTEREPDEIQIHIGRIEVTAVPAQVAPAAVKPARKGPSLDEYLKRRGGAAR